MKSRKQAPEKKLVLPGSINEKYVRKLVFLHNHLMQYYGVSYQEVIMVYERPSFVLVDPTPMIYYEPTTDIGIVNKQHLTSIYNILDKYLTTRNLTAFEMKYANTVWQWLKEKAGITDV